MTITVSELIEILSRWPKTRNNGAPTEVWIDTGNGFSSSAECVIKLDSDGQSFDALISHDNLQETT